MTYKGLENDNFEKTLKTNIHISIMQHILRSKGRFYDFCNL